MRLGEVIQAINGNINFCIRNSATGATFFVAESSVSGNIIKFIDIVDGIKYKENLDNFELITFSDNTVPAMLDLSDIKSFLRINADDHIQNNLIFDDYVHVCRKYTKIFNKQSVNIIKKNVLDDDTSDLDKLKIIGCKYAFELDKCNSDEEYIVRTSYKKLVNTKLNEALLSIDQFIIDVDDKDFEQEAVIIKEDLSSNAINYIKSIDTIPLDKLFATWPTLLNPSPFNLNIVSI